MGQHRDDSGGGRHPVLRRVRVAPGPGWRTVLVSVLIAGALTVSADMGAADVAAGPAPVEPAFIPIVSLVLRDQPTTATLNTPLDPPVVVAVVDPSGATVPDSGIASVEVALRSPPGVLSPLGGSTSVPVVDGEAVLDDLRIRTTGPGYHLDVEAEVGGRWLEVSSEPFVVVAGEPPRAGHVGAVDCAQAAAGTGLLFLDGRSVDPALITADDARGVRLEHADLAPRLTVPATGTHPTAAVSGRSLLLAADEELAVQAGRLLPSSPVGVWLLSDPPCPLAASGGAGSQPAASQPAAAYHASRTGGGAMPGVSDGIDDAAMVEVTPLGELTVSSDGTVQGPLALPEGLPAGASTVQLVGTLEDGRSMVAAIGVLVTHPRFADVDPASVHAPAIRRITALGISTGRVDGTYGPGATVTRGQMASFLARALELDTGSGASFPDALGTVHEGAVAAVADAGIASGYPDGRFGVGEPIRRDQLASMLTAAAGLAPQADGPFVDLDANLHAPAINAVAAAGITVGDGQGRYRPGDAVRRDQMATFLVRLLDHEG